MKRPRLTFGKSRLASFALSAALLGALVVPGMPPSAGVVLAQEPERGASQVKEEGRTLQVTGEGSVTVVPDIVEVRLGVETVSESLSEAWRDASKAMDAVTASLLAQGIDRKDIQTVRYTVSREERWYPLPTVVPKPLPTATPIVVPKPLPVPTTLPVPSSEAFLPALATPVAQASPAAVSPGATTVNASQAPPPVAPPPPPPPLPGGEPPPPPPVDSIAKPEAPIVVYRVTNIVSVKIRQVSAAGDIIDAAIAAGANRIESVGLSVDNPTQYRMEALELAVADAKGKAELLARLTGVTLGPPKTIYFYGSGPIFGKGGGDATPMPAPAFAMPVYSGQTEIRMSVNITYEIE